MEAYPVDAVNFREGWNLVLGDACKPRCSNMESCVNETREAAKAVLLRDFQSC